VLGLGKMAVIVAAYKYGTDEQKESYEIFINSFDKNKIRKAIDTNNYAMALDNFLKMERLFIKLCGDEEDTNAPFSNNKMEIFKYWCVEGINNIFTKDPLKVWDESAEAHSTGMDSYTDSLNQEIRNIVDSFSFTVKE
jgi:hypothetical protein